MKYIHIGYVKSRLSNAIKFTPRAGLVSVIAGSDDKTLWIRVSDIGPGIPVEKQAHLFESLSTLGEIYPSRHGMGLGLHIAHDLLLAHQGRLEMTSTPGMGSQFTLYLPIPSTETLTQSKVMIQNVS